MRPLPGLLLVLAGWTAAAGGADFSPDPRSVQWYGPAYRYPQAGWIVLHVEGEPYERGVQHGRLLAGEIAAHVRCLAAYYGPKAPPDTWKHMRDTVNALFLRGYGQEQREEMKGIADGASAAGARFDSRPIDLVDIVVINAANELEALNEALEATPTGLECLPWMPEGAKSEAPDAAHPPRHPRSTRCSAFAATGPATRDGQIVFGHITMWELYPANFYNLWLDLRPARGHRFVMQSFPGGMHSGMDYTLNDAGILMCETTLSQTGFEIQGEPLPARIRRATQYAESIESAAEILQRSGNGLATEEWILADVKRNEIALLTVGTHQSKLYRSSRNEWLAGAPGFYWGCNNDKDREVRLETAAGLAGRPSAAAAFAPSKRDTLWLAMYDRYRGTIDADFARQALTMPALVPSCSVDAKYTTAEMAKQLKSWGTFGPPLGPAWQPTATERQRYPEVRPLVANPWTVLHTAAPPPAAGEESEVSVVDLPSAEGTELPAPPRKEKDKDAEPLLPAAWHGTLLPKSDADIWLATAFANYERIVALERSLRKQARKPQLGPADLDQLSVSLFHYRTLYELAARAGTEVPLARTQSSFRETNWYHVASGKGVLLLHTLRGLVGAEDFDRLMDEFGRAHAGKETTSAEFQAHFEKGTGRRWAAFFDAWLNRTGLPRLELRSHELAHTGQQWTATAIIGRDTAAAPLAVSVTLETAKGEETETARLEGPEATVAVSAALKPRRLVVDKYALSACSNGAPFGTLTFDSELERSLIVYGTLDETATNAEAAEKLQEALRRREHNIRVPIRKDSEATADELKTHHLLLIGRPDSNRLVARFRDSLPVRFGPHSFEVRGEAYAHPESAVLVAAENPLQRRYSMVVIAGLGGLATLRTVAEFEDDSMTSAEVVVFPYNQEENAFVTPAKELVREFPEE